MPYYISKKAKGCSGWATVKADGEVMGCHTNKQSAINQAVAISLAEKERFGGELGKRDLSGEKVIISDIDGTLIFRGKRDENVWNYIQEEEGLLFLVTGRPESTRDETVKELEELGITYSRLIMNDGSTATSNTFKKKTAQTLLETYNVVMAIENNPTARAGYRSVGILTINPASIKDYVESDSEDSEEESRAVDLSAPAFMRAAARRGLKLYEEGKGGDGLVDSTIREARDMAAGRVTADKWKRISAWIARHMVDLDAPQNSNPSDPDYPGAGLVAHLLWGSSGTKRGAERTKAYADRIVARLEADSNRGSSMSKREIRTNVADFEIRESGNGMTFSGYAAVFDSPSEPLPFVEIIKPGAFRKSLQGRHRMMLLWNHDSSQPLASTRNGSLRMVEDEIGLKVTATLPNTQLGRDISEMVRTGLIDAMSFGFRVKKDSWNADGSIRTLEEVAIFESSLVSFPAYEGTAGMVAVREHRDIDPNTLADGLLRLESGEELSEDHAAAISEVVAKLTKTEEVQAVEGDILALKKKKLDLLMKEGI